MKPTSGDATSPISRTIEPTSSNSAIVVDTSQLILGYAFSLYLEFGPRKNCLYQITQCETIEHPWLQRIQIMSCRPTNAKVPKTPSPVQLLELSYQLSSTIHSNMRARTLFYKLDQQYPMKHENHICTCSLRASSSICFWVRKASATPALSVSTKASVTRPTDSPATRLSRSFSSRKALCFAWCSARTALNMSIQSRGCPAEALSERLCKQAPSAVTKFPIPWVIFVWRGMESSYKSGNGASIEHRWFMHWLNPNEVPKCNRKLNKRCFQPSVPNGKCHYFKPKPSGSMGEWGLRSKTSIAGPTVSIYPRAGQ